MTQTQRREYLISELLNERQLQSKVKIPSDAQDQKILLRSLFNLRSPMPSSDEFLAVQDAYLQNEILSKGITDINDLNPIRTGIYLWKGDITTLKCDAIVNAANSKLLGCFCPNHGCIDNAIHTFAGVQLRLKCYELMKKQGHDEKTGTAKITPAFNLPCRYILHTVGPIVGKHLSHEDCRLLSSCYRTCLETAEANGVKSIALCCISTGEFHFPNDKAAQIAIDTVTKYKKQFHSDIEVIFNVFKEADYSIYKQLLGSTK